MSEPRTIKINEVEYVRKGDIGPKVVPGPVKIVVVGRGFVYVGAIQPRLSPQTGDYVWLQNAYNIRIWGTTKGLGELVNGPTKATKLDKVGSIQIPLHAVISIIDVDQKSWKL